MRRLGARSLPSTCYLIATFADVSQLLRRSVTIAGYDQGFGRDRSKSRCSVAVVQRDDGCRPGPALLRVGQRRARQSDFLSLGCSIVHSSRRPGSDKCTAAPRPCPAALDRRCPIERGRRDFYFLFFFFSLSLLFFFMLIVFIPI